MRLRITIITSSLLLIGMIATAQSFDIRHNFSKVDSADFFVDLDTIISRFNIPAQSGYTAIYYSKYTSTDGAVRFRWGVMNIVSNESRETYFIQPHVVDPFSEKPSYINHPKENSQVVETPKSVSKALKQLSSNHGYFVQSLVVDGKKKIRRDEVIFISLRKGNKNIVSLIKYGTVVVLYKELNKNTNNAKLETVLSWVLDYYVRQ